MKPERQKHEGHQIELRERKGEPELLIDNVPVRFGKLPDGKYFLNDYAYDRTDDLMELARRYVEHQRKSNKIRLDRQTEKRR
jgi:hypothetical protein